MKERIYIVPGCTIKSFLKRISVYGLKVTRPIEITAKNGVRYLTVCVAEERKVA